MRGCCGQAAQNRATSGGGQLTEGEAADQPGDDHGRRPSASTEKAGSSGCGRASRRARSASSEHPAGQGRGDHGRQRPRPGRACRGSAGRWSATPTSSARPVRRHASAVRSCGAVASDAEATTRHPGGQPPVKLATPSTTAATATAASTTSIAGLLGKPVPLGIARSVRAQPRHAAAAVSRPASASRRRGGPARCRRAAAAARRGSRTGDEGQRGADPGEEGALVGEREARVGLVAVGVDAARPAVLGVGHAAIIPGAGRRGRRPCRGRGRSRGRRTRRGRAGWPARWSRAPRSPRAVLRTAAQCSRPMATGCPGTRRRPPARAPPRRSLERRGQDPADDLGRDVGQVDQGDEREVGVAPPRGAPARPAATPPCPRPSRWRARPRPAPRTSGARPRRRRRPRRPRRCRNRPRARGPRRVSTRVGPPLVSRTRAFGPPIRRPAPAASTSPTVVMAASLPRAVGGRPGGATRAAGVGWSGGHARTGAESALLLRCPAGRTGRRREPCAPGPRRPGRRARPT